LKKLIHKLFKRTKNSLVRLFSLAFLLFSLIIFFIFNDYLPLIVSLTGLLYLWRQHFIHLKFFIKKINTIFKGFIVFIHTVGLKAIAYVRNILVQFWSLIRKVVRLIKALLKWFKEKISNIFAESSTALLNFLKKKRKYYKNLIKLKKYQRQIKSEIREKKVLKKSWQNYEKKKVKIDQPQYFSDEIKKEKPVKHKTKKYSIYNKIYQKLLLYPLKKIKGLLIKILLWPLSLFKKIIKEIIGKKRQEKGQKELKAKPAIKAEKNKKEGTQTQPDKNNRPVNKKYNQTFPKKRKRVIKNKIKNVFKRAAYSRQHGGFEPKINSQISKYKNERRSRFFKLIKNVFSGPLVKKSTITIFLLVLIWGVFGQAINENLPLENDISPEESQMESAPLEIEGEVLGQKTVKQDINYTLSQKVGLFFAGISLLFGTIFFLYSLKYYFSSLIVLIGSQSYDKKPPRGLRKLLYKIFFRSNGNYNGINSNGSFNFLANGNGNGNGGNKQYPFVSIHLAFYNEKKVANRILTACTSFDYPNYEVIVADDSSDETVEILEKWKKHPRVKIIHRDNRQGYKGMALQEAVDQMDPRTEFVMVFDADFIPYPDTIKQFIKYFPLNGNGNGNNGYNHYKDNNIAAVQGYQWHVLNKNENWITRSVRSEFAGSYVVERPGRELMGALKQIAGSVYMIRADVLKSYGWTDSITEDFELTLRIYRDGWKVVFSPYLQAPAECVSTLKRLIRQRMRWAEGHTRNIRRYFWDLLKSRYMNRREKMEFFYLSPYYLQSLFLLIGTACWFISDLVLGASLPFWSALWGWSLVFVNLFALPLLNCIGLFFEQSPEKDYLGIFSFIALTYIVAPFQAIASLKGLIRKKPGGWFRTPKSGHVTNIFYRSRYRRWIKKLFPSKKKKGSSKKSGQSPYLKLKTSSNKFEDFKVRKRKGRKITHIVSVFLLITTLALQILSSSLPTLKLANQNRGDNTFISLKKPNQSGLSFKTGQPVHSFSTITSSDYSNKLDQPEENNIIDKSNKLSLEQSPTKKLPQEKTSPKLKKDPNSDSDNKNEKKQDEKNQKKRENIPPDNIRAEPVRKDPLPENVKEDLPENIKKEVKIALADFPEDKEEIELTNLRTKKSKYILKKDGHMEHQVGMGALHYQKEDGSWADINTNIKPLKTLSVTQNQDQNIQYANETNLFKTYFNSDFKNQYLKYQYQGKNITFSLPEHPDLGLAKQNKPEIENNKITYPEIYPGIDLRYTISDKNLLEEYIVHSPEALENLTYVIQEFENPGTYFEQKDDGEIYFFNQETNKKLWRFPRPVLYELKNKQERNYDLTREIKEKDGQYISKKILNESAFEWLNSSERNYPIVIDESIESNYSDTNYLDGYLTYDGSSYSKTESSDQPLKLGGDQTPDPDESYRVYVRFDISELDDSITYEAVNLFINIHDAQGSGNTTDINSLDNDPDDRTASELWNDIGSATSTYINDYWAYTSARWRVHNLGSTALTDLNNALTDDWFGVSFVSSNETDDLAGISSEEDSSNDDRPSLGAMYDLIETDNQYSLSHSRRNTFFDSDNSKYWVVQTERDEGRIYGYYSSDGDSWTKDSNWGDTSSGTYGDAYFSQDRNKVYAHFWELYDIRLLMGEVGASSITWDDAGDKQTILDGNSSSDEYKYSSFTIDADGYCWVAAQYENSGSYDIYTIRSSNTDCTSWGTATKINTTSASNNNEARPEIVPCSSDGDVYVLWERSNNGYARRWDDSDSTWEDIDDLGASNAWLSAVRDDNYDVHIHYVDGGVDPTYVKYDESADSYSTPLELYSGFEVYPNIAMDTETNEIYAVWNSIEDDPKREIEYMVCDTDNDCSNISNWSSRTELDFAYYGFAFTLSIRNPGRVWAITQEGLHGIDVQHIIIPESVWFLIPIIVWLPKQIQKLRQKSKGRKKRKKSASGGKKKRWFSKLFSFFGFKKKNK